MDDSIVLEVELTASDWEAVQTYLADRRRARMPLRDRRFSSLFLVVAGLTVLIALNTLAHAVSTTAFVVGFALFAGSAAAFVLRERNVARLTLKSAASKRTRHEFDAHGVRIIREFETVSSDWRSVVSIDESAEHVFIPLDRLAAYVIPKRDIVGSDPAAFVARLRAWHAQRGASGATLAAPALPPASTTVGHTASAEPLASPQLQPRDFWHGLKANLLAGLRAFVFRRVGLTDFEVSFEQIAALLGISLIVATALDWVGAGPDDELVPANFYTWSALLLLGLWGCAVIARVSKPRLETRVLVAIALSIAPWALIVACACSFMPALTDDDSNSLLLIIAILIVLWGSVRVVYAAYGSLRLPALAVIFAAIAAAGFADNYLDFDPHVWEQIAQDNDESTGWQDAESTFYDQPAFIDESLDKIAPQRPGVTDLYYVGFAGDGDQRIFRREVLFGEHAFAARMGTGPRSLDLVNDRESRADYPLATVSGLRYALSALGKMMDPREDILVLFLTSHGSREGGIFVRTGITPVDNDLPPDEVRSALDDAGIRWRIVIVSACYSGVFVEPLKSDTTMIITAADSQNTSFGCQDDLELTYFGAAFLRDSLPREPSLEAAFEHARKEIADREALEQLTPSNPQMWVGASMSRKLAQLGPLPLAAAIPTSSTK